MLKHNFAINLMTAGLLVVPAVTLQSGTSASLSDALQKTAEALEVVAGIEQRVQDADPEAISEIVRFTEAPIADAEDPGAADRLLETLRAEVAQLQLSVDEARREHLAEDLPDVETLLEDEPRVALPAGTTGLDDGMRKLLSKGPLRVAPAAQAPLAELEAAKPAEPVAVQPAARTTTSLEGEGYAADPVRLGRALYQKGRYQEALDVLARAPGELEARYWKARSLEKLDRFGEALDEFAQVAASEDGGHFVDRAREDIDFLRWRMAFQGKDKGPK